jgi:hypothetical protein
MAQSSGGFNVGDPVQLVGNPHRLGKVTAFSAPIAMTATQTMPMPYVKFPGSICSEVHHIDCLKICKCVDRIPKGVSRC